MKPKRIILIRHGESEGNINEGIYAIKPDYQLRLTEKGFEQAENCGKQLKEITKDENCFFYVSPLWRTRDTYNQIIKAYQESSIEKREDPRIREQEWGHLKDIAECNRINDERDNYGVFYYRIPEGESAADVYDRVSDFYGTLHRDFEKENFPENCIIVTHGMTIRLFLMKWFHCTVEDFHALKNPENCAIIILEKKGDDKYELITELKKKKEAIIIEIGKKGCCSRSELHYFLPNLPTLHGSEFIFSIGWSNASRYLNNDVESFVKGLHYIELKYKEFMESTIRNEGTTPHESSKKMEFGFGSPSPSAKVIAQLQKLDKVLADELTLWISENGGNYYISY